MTSVPFPSFSSTVPVDTSANKTALPAVGRCRIYPETCAGPQERDEYRAIVSKNREQALVDTENTQDASAAKKLKKKFMKEGVAMAKHFLETALQLDVSVIDVEIVVNSQDLVETDGCLAACLLDAGCCAIVTDGTDLDALDAAKIPRERLVAHFDDKVTQEQVQAATESLAGSISVELLRGKSVTLGSVETLLPLCSSGDGQTLGLTVQFSTEDCDGKTEEEVADLVGTICKLFKDGNGTVALVDTSAMVLGLSFAACMKTDREDGLFTTVVCTRSGEALGLVYSSKESIVAALECGRGVYYSRSRKGLWRKGDTSGHYQTLHRLDVDCDGDALRFTVTQRGEDTAAFCHLNTLTCWGEPVGLRHLEATLKDRLASAPEGSYTKRLFDDPELLRDKLVEEAQELSEATEKKHVAEELADVLYFAMTRAAKAGVSIDDAAAELDRRARKVTRRKGDSKAFRIAAGKEILDKKD